MYKGQHVGEGLSGLAAADAKNRVKLAHQANVVQIGSIKAMRYALSPKERAKVKMAVANRKFKLFTTKSGVQALEILQ